MNGLDVEKLNLSGFGGGVSATNPRRNFDDDRRLFAGCLETVPLFKFARALVLLDLV